MVEAVPIREQRAAIGTAFEGLERRTLQSLPLALVVLGIDDEILFANDAAERFLGQSLAALQREGLKGLTGGSNDLASDRSGLMALLAEVREQGNVVAGLDVEFRGPQDDCLLAHVQLSPLVEGDEATSERRADDERKPGWPILMQIHDAAAAGQIDRQFAADASSRATSGMAAVLAHEVRNPLSGIRGAAQLIAQGATEEDRRLAQLVCDEVDRIGALIDRMETLSDPRPNATRPINVHEVLDHVIGVAAAGFAARMNIRTDYDPSLPPVPAERGRLIQIFLNILKNAAEARPSRTNEIRISTAYRHGARLVVHGDGAGESVAIETPIEISVHDDGPGVSPEISDNLFSPFVTAKAGGTGLGLALVQKLVAEIDGRVDCESSAQGATFRLQLPAWKETEARESET